MSILAYKNYFGGMKMEDLKQDFANVCLRQGKKVKVEFDIPLEDIEDTKNLKGNVKISCVDKEE